MRIASNTVYDQGIAAVQRNQTGLFELQQQIASGRRVLQPSDDPIAASRSLEVSQSLGINRQHSTNVESAKSSLGLEESILNNVTENLQRVRELSIQALSSTLQDENRQAIAVEIEARYNEMVGLANAQDGNEYLFSGFKGNTQPFAVTPSGVVYQGDQGQRLIEIGPKRQIPISDSGHAVFEHIRNGNGTFQTGVSGANTGQGVIDGGSVINSGLLTGNNYSITFTVAAGVTTYDVTNTTTAATVATAVAFRPGDTISFDGLQVKVDGTPASGDQFTIAPAGYQSIFETYEDLIAALKTPVTNGPQKAQLFNSLNQALGNIDQAMGNVLTVRAAVGARMHEAESIQATGEDLALQYQTTLSGLQDLDFAKAISDAELQRVYLEAAQKSYLRVTGASLFNFI